MSSRYPVRTVCPHCGLGVMATRDGQIRPHASRAQDAGFRDAPCAKTAPMLEAEEAEEWRRRALDHRREYWDRRDPDTALPKHLR